MTEIRSTNLYSYTEADFRNWPRANSDQPVTTWSLESTAPPKVSLTRLLSPVQAVAAGFDSAIVSWNALTPPGTWLEFQIRAQLESGWTKFYKIAVWGPKENRYSFDPQEDADGEIATDTLFLKTVGQAFQIAVIFSASTLADAPRLDFLTVNTARRGTFPTIKSDRQAWGKILPVPEYSQMLYPQGEVLCSPTSLAMVLDFWAAALNRPEISLNVLETACAVFDKVYDGCGNWPFNTAHAASFGGLRAYVTRLNSLAELEKFILQGIPLIISLAYQTDALPGTPISFSDGHLLVVRGFDSAGDVVTNDPAANPAKGQTISITYPRTDFERQWLKTSGGGAYVIFPSDYNLSLL